MNGFTNFQRLMWYWLTYFSVCRYYIEQDADGSYKIKKVGWFRLFIYYGMWVNTLIKIGYLILTYRGYLIEIHFLDQMSIWDWFLCFSQLIQECNMWYRKYPLYEIIYANWKIQEEVFRKLGSPKHLEKKINANDKSLVIMHVVIVFGGCGFLMVQYFSAPKYALNTYAVVPYDNWVMMIVFGAHEYLYMFHIWSHQASSIVLCEVFAASKTHIMREMTICLECLIDQGRVIQRAKKLSSKKPTRAVTGTVGSGRSRLNSKYNYQYQKRLRRMSEDEQKQRHEQISEEIQLKITKRYLDPSMVVQGTGYDIKTLLEDYKKLMLSTTAFNRWAGFLQGGTTGSNYGQFISDVFMLIQLLKEPDTDLLSVAFFCEDAMAGMIMLFRMLIIISRLYPASEEFLRIYKVYLTHEVPEKKYWLKHQRTLRIIAAKLGGYSTKAITVPKGINALMNYYIGAAMWQRPVDRRT